MLAALAALSNLTALSPLTGVAAALRAGLLPALSGALQSALDDAGAAAATRDVWIRASVALSVLRLLQALVEGSRACGDEVAAWLGRGGDGVAGALLGILHASPAVCCSASESTTTTVAAAHFPLSPRSVPAVRHAAVELLLATTELNAPLCAALSAHDGARRVILGIAAAGSALSSAPADHQLTRVAAAAVALNAFVVSTGASESAGGGSAHDSRTAVLGAVIPPLLHALAWRAGPALAGVAAAMANARAAYARVRTAHVAASEAIAEAVARAREAQGAIGGGSGSGDAVFTSAAGGGTAAADGAALASTGMEAHGARALPAVEAYSNALAAARSARSVYACARRGLFYGSAAAGSAAEAFANLFAADTPSPAREKRSDNGDDAEIDGGGGMSAHDDSSDSDDSSGDDEMLDDDDAPPAAAAAAASGDGSRSSHRRGGHVVAALLDANVPGALMALLRDAADAIAASEPPTHATVYGMAASPAYLATLPARFRVGVAMALVSLAERCTAALHNAAVATAAVAAVGGRGSPSVAPAATTAMLPHVLDAVQAITLLTTHPSPDLAVTHGAVASAGGSLWLAAPALATAVDAGAGGASDDAASDAVAVDANIDAVDFADAGDADITTAEATSTSAPAPTTRNNAWEFEPLWGGVGAQALYGDEGVTSDAVAGWCTGAAAGDGLTMSSGLDRNRGRSEADDEGDASAARGAASLVTAAPDALMAGLRLAALPHLLLAALALARGAAAVTVAASNVHVRTAVLDAILLSASAGLLSARPAAGGASAAPSAALAALATLPSARIVDSDARGHAAALLGALAAAATSTAAGPAATASPAFLIDNDAHAAVGRALKALLSGAAAAAVPENAALPLHALLAGGDALIDAYAADDPTHDAAFYEGDLGAVATVAAAALDAIARRWGGSAGGGALARRKQKGAPPRRLLAAARSVAANLRAFAEYKRERRASSTGGGGGV